MSYTPVPLPENTPEVMAITLWDFSWYVRTAPGDAFDDLDRAFAEAVDRGYNTIRICAMPFLLFRSGLDTTKLRLGPLGRAGTPAEGYAQGTRWYDVKAPTVIDGKAHLLELFRAAQRHDVHIILSSWEWQQSTSFALERDWFDAIMAIEPENRLEVLADSLADLVDWAVENGVDDRIAFTELHNEVAAGHLTEGLTGDSVAALEPRLSRGLARFHQRHPDRPVTVNYSGVPTRNLGQIPAEIDVFVVHPYINGVLDALIDEFALRTDGSAFPQERASRELLRPGAPTLAEWTGSLPGEDAWKLVATICGKPEIYVHDWCDAAAVDRWLYDHYGEWRELMDWRLEEWIRVGASFARDRGVPFVLGEGYVGYTPLAGTFEEGPVGAEICRRAVSIAASVGAAGAVVCSNAAPQHPMWADVALQRECVGILTSRLPSL